VTNRQTDRQTDRPRYSVCSSRPLSLANAAMRPKSTDVDLKYELISKALRMKRVKGLTPFTCHPHVYQRIEWAILPQRITALWPVLISHLKESWGWVGLGDWLHSEVICPPDFYGHSLSFGSKHGNYFSLRPRNPCYWRSLYCIVHYLRLQNDCKLRELYRSVTHIWRYHAIEAIGENTRQPSCTR